MTPQKEQSSNHSCQQDIPFPKSALSQLSGVGGIAIPNDNLADTHNPTAEEYLEDKEMEFGELLTTYKTLREIAELNKGNTFNRNNEITKQEVMSYLNKLFFDNKDVLHALKLKEQETEARILGITEELQESRDCNGYQEHKVLTTNLIYKYPLEDAKSVSMRRLKDFAMGCYKNGWLQALEELTQKIKDKKE